MQHKMRFKIHILNVNSDNYITNRRAGRVARMGRKGIFIEVLSPNISKQEAIRQTNACGDGIKTDLGHAMV